MKKFLIVLFLAGILLFGCTQSNNQNPPADNQNQQNNANDNMADNSNNDAMADNDGQNTDSMEDAFSQLVGNLTGTPSYKATYNVSITGDSVAMSGTYTNYFKLPKMRVDVQLQGTQARTWILPEKIVSCSTTDGEEQCYEMTQQPSTAPQTLDADEMEQNRANYSVRALPSRTIANETANCFEVTVTGSTPVTSEYCLASDGVMLYLKAASEYGQSEMTATSVTRSVTDAEMTPPAASAMPGAGDYPGMPEGFDPSMYQ